MAIIDIITNTVEAVDEPRQCQGKAALRVIRWVTTDACTTTDGDGTHRHSIHIPSILVMGP